MLYYILTYKTLKTRLRGKRMSKINRIGETNIANNGQTMTIIEYRGFHDIDVQFEDGTVVKNTAYDKYKKVQIKNHNYIINETNISKILFNKYSTWFSKSNRYIKTYN